MKIYIDGDSSPIIKTTENIAKKYHIPTIVVKNMAHNIISEYSKIITVDLEKDAADFYILGEIKSGDILISQDQGLISIALSKGANCITEMGKIITENEIDFILNNRYLSQKLRREERVYTKFKKREPKDDSLFKTNLVKLIESIIN